MIDLAQVRHADEDIRDLVYRKMANYIKLLYKMKKVPWEGFTQVPKENIYNMNEMATKTSKHRKKKTLGRKETLAALSNLLLKVMVLYLFHITIYVTTCASGLYKVSIQKLEGAPPPMITHFEIQAKTSKPTPVKADTFYQNPMCIKGLGDAYIVSAEDKSTEANP